MLDLHVEGARGVVIVLAMANAVLGSSLGLFVSAFAQTEFRQWVHARGGVSADSALRPLRQRAEMATWLRWVSDALPLTCAYDALARTASGTYGSRFAIDIGVVARALAGFA